MKPRIGFTIIELLVVIAIIGLLIALLMPALNSSREAARLTKCRNNLRQVAIAGHQFQAIHQVYPGYGGEEPPAGTRFKGQTANRRQTSQADRTRTLKFHGVNWIIQTLPFMEETNLENDLIRLAKSNHRSGSEIESAVESVVETLYCPSRRDAAAYPLHRRFRTNYGDLGARTDYAINGGSSQSSGRMISIEGDGVWIVGHHVGQREITDGSSKTYFVGEKAMERDQYTTGTDRGDLNPIAALAKEFGAANSYVRYAVRTPSSDSIGNCLACHDFGSAHTGVWNVAMCDGSVQSKTFEMAVAIHRAFSTINSHDRIE